MERVGQTVVQGSQGISSSQKKTGFQSGPGSGLSRSSRVAWLRLEDLALGGPGSLGLDLPAQEASGLDSGEPAPEERARGLGDLVGVARLDAEESEGAGLAVELVAGGEASGYEDRVHLVAPRRVEEGLPVLSTLATVARSTRPSPSTETTVVERQDRHAHAPDLVGVDLVAADPVGDLDDGRHLDTGLQGVVGGDEAYVPRARDEDSAGGLDPVAVDQGLEGAGAIDPRQVVAGEERGNVP